MELTGKVVLVTGGTSGIGLGIAQALAAEGCSVVVAGRNQERLQKAISKYTEGHPIQGHICDVANRQEVTDLFEWLVQALGDIDILVNCAGINTPNRMMANVDPEDFDRIMAVNMTGTYNCIHAALPLMRKKQSGLIVNVLSVAGWRALPLAGAPYCVSKSAAAALGRFVNLEEADNGIKLTNLYPGETNTPLLDQRPDPPPQTVRAQMLQPEDVAACVVMVAKLPPRAVVPELVVTPPHMMMD